PLAVGPQARKRHARHCLPRSESPHRRHPRRPPPPRAHLNPRSLRSCPRRPRPLARPPPQPGNPSSNAPRAKRQLGLFTSAARAIGAGGGGGGGGARPRGGPPPPSPPPPRGGGTPRGAARGR